MDTLEDALQRNPHLQRYLDDWEATGRPMPTFYPVLSRDLKGETPYNFLYPVGDPIFVHVVEQEGALFPRYYGIQPALNEGEHEVFEAIKRKTFELAPDVKVPETTKQYQESLDELMEMVVGKGHVTVGAGFRKKRLPVDPIMVEKVRFLLYRDIVEHGIIEPVMHDTWIEDIHALGMKNLHVVHKIFGMVETNLRWDTPAELDHWLEGMGERMGRPVSGSSPVVDGALPNGSRINIIYSEEISVGGSSWTVRKFSDVPFPATQIVTWNTFSARLAAYLWLCLQFGMSVFVAGETASGKTTTLNAILAFIKPKSKIMTAEDTPEVLPPHPNWQQLITRDKGEDDETSVTMYDLLKAGLRSRPNYIIVGEIRGAEGAVAFQAMQTGHPTMATFHASSVAKLIQRFTSDPISVPMQFMPNLNVVLIQMAVYVKGKMLRRVLAVDEVEGYSKKTGTAITRQVFTWDSVKDEFQFGGRNNSYVLEQLVAPKMGLDDPRHIYVELDKRTVIIEELVRREHVDYHEMSEMFFNYAEVGDKALPFDIDDVWEDPR